MVGPWYQSDRLQVRVWELASPTSESFVYWVRRYYLINLFSMKEQPVLKQLEMQEVLQKIQTAKAYKIKI